MPTALVTGASRGIGRAIADALVAHGWHVVVDGRDADALADAATRWRAAGAVTAVPGDLADPAHRAALLAAVGERGPLHLLVANAGTLGPVPLPPVADLGAADLRDVLEVNVVASALLVAAALPALGAGDGAVVHLTSDAAVEAYPGWGAYGASKAALDHLMAVLAAEHPERPVWALDPGDVDTDMHAAAIPDADPDELRAPAEVAGALLTLLRQRPSSGRVRAGDLLAATAGAPA